MVAYTELVDSYADPNPFTDKLIWKIDDTVDAVFPDNVKQYNGNIYPS